MFFQEIFKMAAKYLLIPNPQSNLDNTCFERGCFELSKTVIINLLTLETQHPTWVEDLKRYLSKYRPL